MKSINKILILITIATYPLFSSCSSIPSNIKFEQSDDLIAGTKTNSGVTSATSAIPQGGQVFYVGPPASTANPSKSISPTSNVTPLSTPTPTPKVTPTATVTPSSTPTPSPTPTNTGGSSSGGSSSSSGGSTGVSNITGGVNIDSDSTKPQYENSASLNLTVDNSKPVQEIN